MSRNDRTDTVVEVNNLTAGYLPGVNILNEANLIAAQGRAHRHHRTERRRASRRCSRRSSARSRSAAATIRLNGEDITGLKADKLVARGVGFVPQTNNVFPSLTIEENLQMGLYQNPKIYEERLEFVTGHLRRTRQAPQAARRFPLGWRAPDGGDVPCAHDGPARAAARRARPPACRPCVRTRPSSGSPRSTRPA